MRNRAFWRAIHSLAHPMTVVMVALALLNDHVFRQHWPSWWTGKLSDFAWLAFAPLIVLVLLACLVPAKLQRRETLIEWLSFGSVGFGFALAKTIPQFHLLAVSTLEMFTGWESGLRLDPTDLITLPALLIGWQIWRHSRNQATISRRGWIIMGLGVLATLANSVAVPVLDYGISCVTSNNSLLMAVVGGEGVYYTVYTSDDGGLDWTNETSASSELVDTCSERPYEEWTISDPDNPLVMYRFRPGAGIDNTNDGGQSWVQELDLFEVSHEARTAYYQENTPPDRFGTVVLKTGPLDALIDPDSGNVVVAMGQEGTLVREANGHWRWVSVGPYSLRRFDQVEFLQLLVPSELLASLVLAGLALTTIIRPVRNDSGYGGTFLFLLAWIAWAIAILMFLPNERAYGLFLISNQTGYFVAILIAIAFAVSQGFIDIIDVFSEKPTALVTMSLTAITTALLFMLPYIMWTQGNIQHYSTATLFSLALTAATIYAGQQYIKRVFQGKPLVRKRKKADESSPRVQTPG